VQVLQIINSLVARSHVQYSKWIRIWADITRMTYGSDERALEPAEEAALLLFRVGFAILFVLLPVAAFLSRRALVIIAPVGGIVMLLAAVMLRVNAEAGRRFRDGLLSPVGMACLFLLVWSTLSLLWTPYTSAGAERLFRLAGTGLISLGVIAALPQRMRTSNLYLPVIGVSLAIVVWMVMWASGLTADYGTAKERGSVLACMLAWPAVTWLSMKRRSVAAMLIGGSIGLMAFLQSGLQLLPALLVGATLLGGAINNPRSAAAALISAVAVLIMGAPMIALLLSFLAPQETAFGNTLQIWADIIKADPTRLLTGHGLETALRNRVSAGLDPAAPKSLLFEVWYELGLLGAMAASVALCSTIYGISTMNRTICAFALGCVGFIFTLSVLGLGTSQTWWISAISVVCIAFAAVARGEYLTKRPAAISEQQA
jgi:hypothetical protein